MVLFLSNLTFKPANYQIAGEALSRFEGVAAEIGLYAHAFFSFRLDFTDQESSFACGQEQSIPVGTENSPRFLG